MSADVDAAFPVDGGAGDAADVGRLLEDHDAPGRVEAEELVGGGEPGGPRADDDGALGGGCFLGFHKITILIFQRKERQDV